MVNRIDFVKKIILFVFCLFIFGCGSRKTTFLDIDGIGININGDFVKYVDIGGAYIEDGASYNGKIVESVTYHNHGRQVAKIDTRFPNSYLVTYRVNLNNKIISANRIVIVDDLK